MSILYGNPLFRSCITFIRALCISQFTSTDNNYARLAVIFEAPRTTPVKIPETVLEMCVQTDEFCLRIVTLAFFVHRQYIDFMSSLVTLDCFQCTLPILKIFSSCLKGIRCTVVLLQRALYFITRGYLYIVWYFDILVGTVTGTAFCDEYVGGETN